MQNTKPTKEEYEVIKRDFEFQEIIRKSMLPRRHVRNNHHVDSDGPWGQAMASMTAAFHEGKCVTLAGRSGTGKTQMAVSAAIDIARECKRVLYTTALDLADDLIDAQNDGKFSRQLQIYTRTELLIIDEVHEGRDTEFQHKSLQRVIFKRYDSMLPTCLITNQTRDGFAELMGPSVVSRLNEIGLVIDCDWTSYRQPQVR